MGAVLAILDRILALLGGLDTIRSLLAALGLAVDKTAKEHSEYLIEGIVATTSVNVAHPTYGLSALHTDIADVKSSILAALDGLVVQYPPEAPGWYEAPPTPPDVNSIADAVWWYASARQTPDDDPTALTMIEMVDDLWAVCSYRHAWFGTPFANRPEFSWAGWRPENMAESWATWWSWTTAWVGMPPAVDWSAWLDSDTPYSFLARTQPGYGWTNTDPAGNTSTDAWKQIEGYPGTHHGGFIRSNFARPGLIYATTPPALPAPPVTIDAPPVWTGLAGVTLGDEVALVDQLVLAGPMDGVLVNVTTPPTRTGQYVIGGETYDYKAGEISFATDRGDVEPWQYLGFRQAIFTPRTMTSADSALFRVLYGAGGTVRTFTRV